jgi:hypothetical protein
VVVVVAGRLVVVVVAGRVVGVVVVGADGAGTVTTGDLETGGEVLGVVEGEVEPVPEEPLEVVGVVAGAPVDGAVEAAAGAEDLPLESTAYQSFSTPCPLA